MLSFQFQFQICKYLFFTNNLPVEVPSFITIGEYGHNQNEQL